jgi:alkylation response protein AidB-like acyl-CoA dehydrogenase
MCGFVDISHESHKRFLPKLCSMQHFASHCLTEPAAGLIRSLVAARQSTRRI